MSENHDTKASFEPRIVAIFCNWCTYTASDLAGTSRMSYPSNARIIRVMCSGRVDPQFVLAAFRQGADGVLIGGCHPNDCHYQEGNYKALRRVTLLKKMLAAMGIEEQRLRLEWISASEGDRVQSVIAEMTEQVRDLGPLKLEVREQTESLEEHGSEADAQGSAADQGTESAASVGGSV